MDGLPGRAPNRELSFADIVGPEGPPSAPQSDFIQHFCAKQFLHIPSNDRTRFEYLFSWKRINEILALNLLDRKRLRVTRDGRDIPPALYRREGSDTDRVIAAKLHDLLRQNASVVINGVQYLSPAIRRLVLQMERTLDQKVNTNGYMTFGSGGAFAMHYDPHDVLVLQVHGTKHWFIYDDPEPSPTDDEKNRAGKPADRNVAYETVLQAGEALYVPRGVYHRAVVTDTDSVHLTFGIHTPKGIDFFQWLQRKIQADVVFREDILTLRGENSVGEQEQALKARLCEIVNSASLMEFLTAHRATRRPSNQFRLGPSEEIDDQTYVAPLLRYRAAWLKSIKSNRDEQSPAAERILSFLVDNELATLGQIKSALAAEFDEAIVTSTIAELVDAAWVEIVH